MARAGFVALWVFLLSACWVGADSGHPQPRTAPETHQVEFSGKVVFVPVEGGFYGILSDAGKRYDPVSKLPNAFQEDGLKVRVRGEIPPTSATVHMWGAKIRIIEIRRR